MRRKFKLALVGSLVGLAATFTIGINPAQAADYVLQQCDSTQFIQVVPASSNHASGQYPNTGGKRTCSWQGRWHIRIICKGGGWSAPRLYIHDDTLGGYVRYNIICDGRQYDFWNNAYPNPNGSQSNRYHMHAREEETTPDAYFQNMNMRVAP